MQIYFGLRSKWRFVPISGLVLTVLSVENVMAGCNPGTQDIAVCISVPPNKMNTPTSPRPATPGQIGGYNGNGNVGAAAGAAEQLLNGLGAFLDPGDNSEALPPVSEPSSLDKYINNTHLCSVFLAKQGKRAGVMEDQAKIAFTKGPKAKCDILKRYIDLIKQTEREVKSYAPCEYPRDPLTSRIVKSYEDLISRDQQAKEQFCREALEANASPDTVGSTDNSPDSTDKKGRPYVKGGCLLVGQPREQNMSPNCGTGVHEWWTPVNVKHDPKCPKPLDGVGLTYKDPTTGKIVRTDTTVSPITTCRTPPTEVTEIR